MDSSEQRGVALGRPFTTKTDWVYEQLRARILGGGQKADGRLRLTALAQEFQISEMPVREALRMLQRDGLVRMENHRGATVINLSWEHAAEIVSMRMHLEVLALREATGRHSSTSIEEIGRLLCGWTTTSRAVGPSSSRRAIAISTPGSMRLARTPPLSRRSRTCGTASGAPAPPRSSPSTPRAWRRRKRNTARSSPPSAAAMPRPLAAAMERHRTNTMASWHRIVTSAGKDR